MKVYDCSNAFSQEFTLKPEWIGTIDFKLDRSFEILEAYKKIYKNDFNSVNKSILELLHLFNKHITEFNIETEQYTVRLNDEVIYLGLSNLGRGEKLFLLCYMADLTKIKIIVSDELTLLTEYYMRLFINLFGKTKTTLTGKQTSQFRRLNKKTWMRITHPCFIFYD